MEETSTITIRLNLTLVELNAIKSGITTVDAIFLTISMLLVFGTNFLLLSGLVSLIYRRHRPPNIPSFLLASLSLCNMLDGVISPILLLCHLCTPYAVLFHWFSQVGAVSSAIAVVPHPKIFQRLPVTFLLLMLWLLPFVLAVPIATSEMPWGCSPYWAGCYQPSSVCTGTWTYAIVHTVFAVVPMLIAIFAGVYAVICMWKNQVTGDEKDKLLTGIIIVIVYVSGVMPSVVEAHVAALWALGSSPARVTAAAASFWLRQLEPIILPTVIICIFGTIRNTVFDLILIVASTMSCPKSDWFKRLKVLAVVAKKKGTSADSETKPETPVLFATVNGLFLRKGKPHLDVSSPDWLSSGGFMYTRCDVYDKCCAEPDVDVVDL